MDDANVYSLYGLTQAEAVAKGIRPIKYIEVESPEFVKEATTIPIIMKQFIEDFDLIWTLTVEKSYAERRGWNDMLAFREFLQNALDEEHEVYGYEGIHVSIDVLEEGTWISDKGRGIKYEAFMLGGHEKRCELRGAFGEGLKIGALWFATHGHDIYAFTRNVVYRVYYSDLANALVVVFGRARWDIAGTNLLIYGYHLPNEYKMLYYKNAGFSIVAITEYSSSSCPIKMPNLILNPPGYLYVRDIFVNTIYNLTGKSSYYSYNLWWVRLEPNRVQVQSPWELENEVGRVLVRCPEALRKVIEDNLVEKEYGGVKYYLLQNDMFEMTIVFPMDIPEETINKIKNIMSSKSINAWSVYGNLDAVTAVGHEGGTVILIPSNLKDFFSKILPKASEFIIQSVSLLAETPIIDERVFNMRQRGFLRECRLLINALGLDTEIKTVEGNRSFYEQNSNTVFFSEYDVKWRKTSTFIHEIAHAYGIKAYGEAPDVSENFERALEEVASIIYRHSIGDEWFSNALSRAKFGAIYASPKRIEEYFGETPYKNMPYNLIYELYSRPKMLVISFDDVVFDIAYIDVEGVPVEEHYRVKMDKIVEILTELFRKYANKSISVGELTYALSKIDIYLNMFMKSKLRNRDLDVVRIYGYNLEEDRYMLIKEIWVGK